MTKKHQLDSFFDPVDKTSGTVDDALMDGHYETVEIPEVVELDHIIDFAMDSYKKTTELAQMVEPKFTLRYYEMADKALSTAKDAIYKKEQLKIARERLKAGNQKGKGKNAPESSEASDSGEGTSRADMLKKAAQMKSGSTAH